MSLTLRIALTPGEPAGIGPDLAVMLAQTSRAHEIVAVANSGLLRERAAALNLPLNVRQFDANSAPVSDEPGSICVADIPLPHAAIPGQLNAENATYVLQCLDRAVEGCVSGAYAAMVTGPIHKGVINDAGIAFTGHTEYLADKTLAHPVMMLTADKLRVALATTHLPLKDVANAINCDQITQNTSLWLKSTRR